MKLTQKRIKELNRQAKGGAKVTLTLASGTYQVTSLGNQLNDAHGRPDPTTCETLEVWLVEKRRTLRVPADEIISLDAEPRT